MLDLAFNQLRQYSRGDMAVALRIARALGEVAEAAGMSAHRTRILYQAGLLEAGLSPDFLPEDRVELDARLRALRERCGSPSEPTPE